MKYWFGSVLAFIIFGYGFLGAQSQAGIQEKMSKQHFQTSKQLQSQIDVKEKHVLVYESLKDIYSNYITDIMKTLAFLIICIGWFITSDKSREFFKKNRPVRISSIIAVVVISIIHIRSQIDYYISSKGKIDELSILSYLDLKYYKNYEITLEQLITNLIQNTVLFVVLILIIFSMKKVTDK